LIHADFRHYYFLICLSPDDADALIIDFRLLPYFHVDDADAMLLLSRVSP